MKKSLAVNHNVVFWIVLALMFILRMPFSWIGTAIPASRAWLDPINEVGTFALIVFLIWWERDNLEIHHMDAFAIFIIILFKPISTLILSIWQPKNPIAFPNLLSFSFFVIALILLAAVLRKKIKLQLEFWKSTFWVLAGGLIGIVLFVCVGIVMIKYFGFPVPGRPDPSVWLNPVFQLGAFASQEEPFFRGFLWGGLKKVGMKDIYILLIQAVLFTAGHLHLLKTTNPVLNLSFIFIVAMVMGIVVWRSRRLSASMMLHGLGNGSAFIQFWIYSLIFK